MMTRKVSTGTLSLPGRIVSASLSSPRSDLLSSDVIDNDALVRVTRDRRRYQRDTTDRHKKCH